MLRSVGQSLVGRVPQSVCNFPGPHIGQFITNSYAGVRRFSLGSISSGNHTDKPSPDQEQQTKVADKTEKAKRSKTPIGKLDELEEGKHPFQEKEPLPPWPDNTNPHTGEVGGPRGPEPTRYGDWERKGRVSDF